MRDLVNRSEGIELYENVPSVEPYYANTGGVVPLFAGGGTRIKILEAGMYCRPVMSTHAGAYGLNLREYDEILYFNDVDSFIEKYTLLRNDEENYCKIANGLKLATESRFSTKAFNSAIDTVLVSCN